MKRSIYVASLLVCSLSAYAGAPESSPKPDPVPKPVAVEFDTNLNVNQNDVKATAGAKSASRSQSNARSRSASASNSRSSARGGDAASTIGDTSANTGPVTVDAASGDSSAENATDVNTTITSDDDVFIPRQTPPVLLPDLIRAGCGAGFGAGGSDPKGAGALSAVFTSDQCYAFQSVSIALAMGEYEMACHLAYDVNRKALKRQAYKPDCKAFADRLNKEAESKSVVKASDNLDLTTYATKEYVDRAFKATVSK